MRIGINKLLKTVLECLHLTMIAALLVVALYTVRKFRIEEMLFPLFFGAFLVLIPTMVFHIASQRCEKEVSYLLWVVLMLAGVYKAAQIIGAEILYLNVRRYYLVFMMILTAVLGIMFFLIRRRNRQRLFSRQMKDASWEDDFLLPDKPRFVFAGWFVAGYLLAQMTACEKVCNIALFGGIIYMVITVIYIYVTKQETYLKLNEKTCGVKNIPVRRMRSIGRQFLLINLLLIFLAMIPALISMKGRCYVDVRDWLKPYEVKEIIYPSEFIEEKEPPEEGERPLFSMIIELVIKALAPVLVAATMIIVLYLIIQGIDSFAGEAEPETDRIESLDEEDVEVVYSFERRRGKAPGDHKIRKAYRKFIRKHREDTPEVFETPHEIEVAAGVAYTAEAKQLHEAYERVRYSPVCDV